MQPAQALLVPSYFDSAEHVRLIELLRSGISPADALRGSSLGYYHLGYHAIIAAVVRAVQADPIRAVLASGPVFLAVFPLGVFFLLRQFTGNLGALFGALLAAWGWSMPAYALNWGKYPLLAGLVLLPVALAAGLHATRNPRWLPLFALLSVSTGLLHTRLLAVVGLAALAWLAAPYLMRLPRFMAVAIPLAATAGMAALAAAQPMLAATFNPYGGLVSALVLLLLPFAFRAQMRATQAGLLFMAGMLAGMHIPAGFVAAGQTALDRPLVETALCLPLAALGGLGLDGLRQALRPHWFAVLAGVCAALVLLTAARAYDPRPDCCIIFSEADAVALDWISAHLPPDARILTAATELRVIPWAQSAPLAGSDAGVWIPILTGRSVLPAPHATDFRARDALRALCGQNISYIYVGGTGVSFGQSALEAQPGWYTLAFSMPPAAVYQVTGCED